jgi:hypothetical protein
VIASISRGASFRGLLAYVPDPKHQPILVGTNMGGRDVPELAREFGTSLRDRRASAAREAVRPVVHVSLSFAREDRRLSHAELKAIDRARKPDDGGRTR